VTWVIESLRRDQTIKVVEDQYNNPTYTSNLAVASAEAAIKGISGILHIGGSDYLSRFEAAMKIASVFDFQPELIQKAKTSEILQKAKRPHYGGLKIERAKKILDTQLMGLDEGLKSLKMSVN
jgi:dTDP-4-dehydrorhamnose reductase